eukprot:TRINITY_DN18864_c0_g1_i1.p1 TRINITY_DN18864_c0_g1~~TRINITY_DN18864_c0_g1_i1.p1  ORF type:complete len:375 (+),score=94.17 TRINITY_DN18864_c0_g1_i1:424-1548(+)
MGLFPHSELRPIGLPSFLYSTSNRVLQALDSASNAAKLDQPSPVVGPSEPHAAKQSARSAIGQSSKFMIPQMAEAQVHKKKIELYSTEYYAAAFAGGALACGPTHWAVTPLDVVKCNMQIDPKKYRSIPSSFAITWREEGVRGFLKGHFPTFIGYSFQGAFKYGGYEVFKKYYSDLAGPENAVKYQQLIFALGSASAEVFADIALCPFEAVKVRVQTQPGYGFGLVDGLPKYVAEDGWAGLYKGIVPLWGRQIPYTVMKFVSFENIVAALYRNVVPIPKNECSKNTQLGVSFAGGYLAGILCATISQPADNIVSFMNNKKGATFGQAVKEIGMTQLFIRGLPLRIVQIGTLTGLQWAIYDSVKVWFGFPTTGGH